MWAVRGQRTSVRDDSVVSAACAIRPRDTDERNFRSIFKPFSQPTALAAVDFTAPFFFCDYITVSTPQHF